MAARARLIWHPSAREDLLEIYTKIAAENPITAERFYDDIETRANRLSEYPRIGPRRSNIQKEMRMLVEGRYLILYETHPDSDEGPIDEVEIVRVIDGRRDVPGLL
jgi:toxin ParE1/3/4